MHTKDIKRISICKFGVFENLIQLKLRHIDATQRWCHFKRRVKYICVYCEHIERDYIAKWNGQSIKKHQQPSSWMLKFFIRFDHLKNRFFITLKLHLNGWVGFWLQDYWQISKHDFQVKHGTNFWNLIAIFEATIG